MTTNTTTTTAVPFPTIAIPATRMDGDVASYRIERDGDILGYASKRTSHTSWTLDTAGGHTLLSTATSLREAALILSDHRDWERNR